VTAAAGADPWPIRVGGPVTVSHRGPFSFGVRLLHFSEDPDIRTFEPRVPPHRPEIEPLVWAVHADYGWTYCFPRECPRILAWPLPTTTPGDLRAWCQDGPPRRVACIEAAWLGRMHSVAIYRYEFEPDGFEALDGDSWMLVSRERRRAVAMDPVGDLVEALVNQGVELRIMPSLLPLRNAWGTTMHVSGMRLRNAVGWSSG
jgi:hypothetical protein